MNSMILLWLIIIMQKAVVNIKSIQLCAHLRRNMLYAMLIQRVQLRQFCPAVSKQKPPFGENFYCRIGKVVL